MRTSSSYSLISKRWVFSKNNVFIDNWVKDFVTKKNLHKRDEIGLQWNMLKNDFKFSIVRVNYMG